MWQYRAVNEMNAGSFSLGCSSRVLEQRQELLRQGNAIFGVHFGYILGTFLGLPGKEGQAEGQRAQVNAELRFLCCHHPVLGTPWRLNLPCPSALRAQPERE